MNNNNVTALEAVYDQYSAAIYGVLLKLCPNKQEAEGMLLQIFQDFFTRDVSNLKPAAIFSTLLKLSFKTALRAYQQGRQVAMGNMHECPALYRVLFEQVCLEEYAPKARFDRIEAGQVIHRELRSLQLKPSI